MVGPGSVLAVLNLKSIIDLGIHQIVYHLTLSWAGQGWKMSYIYKK